MSKTVEEILRETGLSDEQIKALDPKVTTGFTTILSSASAAQEQAELARRAQAEQYEQQIAPALDKWANDKASYDAKMAAYEAAMKSAKEGGFQIPEILAPAQPARTPTGQFVAGGNPVPGSPQYMTREEGFRAVSNTQWVLAEYMRLNNGAVPPDDIETIANEAVAQRMPLRDYAAKKYEFSAKREAIKAAEQKKHDDAIRQTAIEETEKKWAERVGNNPMIRQAESSKFATLEKAVKEGARPDPLKMGREQRHAATRQVISKEIASNTVQ